MSESTRIGDREREATVGVLRAAYEAGRLDVAELETRLDAAWAGRTQPDLDVLRADLPETPPAWAPAPRAKPEPRPRADVAFFVLAMVVMTGIWLATGAGHPWPLWVLLGWGPFVLAPGARPCARPRLPRG
jgi:hypothetical protein